VFTGLFIRIMCVIEIYLYARMHRGVRVSKFCTILNCSFFEQFMTKDPSTLCTKCPNIYVYKFYTILSVHFLYNFISWECANIGTFHCSFFRQSYYKSTTKIIIIFIPLYINIIHVLIR